MSTQGRPVLHFIAGKVGAGKTTLARRLMVPHLQDVLRVGASVVLDFAGNTPRDRAWVRSIYEPVGADHVLHVLDAPDALCLERLRQRNSERPEGVYWGDVSEALFHEVTKYYVPPADAEGFHVVHHDVATLAR